MASDKFVLVLDPYNRVERPDRYNWNLIYTKWNVKEDGTVSTTEVVRHYPTLWCALQAYVSGKPAFTDGTAAAIIAALDQAAAQVTEALIQCQQFPSP